MRNLFIETTVEALVKESWQFIVPDDFDLSAALANDDQDLLEALTGGGYPDATFHTVENIEVYDEHDRRIDNVTLEEPR